MESLQRELTFQEKLGLFIGIAVAYFCILILPFFLSESYQIDSVVFVIALFLYSLCIWFHKKRIFKPVNKLSISSQLSALFFLSIFAMLFLFLTHISINTFYEKGWTSIQDLKRVGKHSIPIIMLGPVGLIVIFIGILSSVSEIKKRLKARRERR